MKLGILFAGQGSQSVGMGKDFYEKSEKFHEIFDILPKEQREIAFEGPLAQLSDTRNTQPVMVAFAAGVLAELLPALEEIGIKPAMAAGLSLGEYSALHSAGVFDAKTAVALVTKRANAMAKAAEGVDCAMKAVLGLDRELLEQCCEKASVKGSVQIANYNCPGQIVIAGEKEAVEAAGSSRGRQKMCGASCQRTVSYCIYGTGRACTQRNFCRNSLWRNAVSCTF